MRCRSFRRCKADDDSHFDNRMSMKRQVILTPNRIDEPALVAVRAMTGGMGAVVYFSGVVRGSEAGESIRAIEYEAFEEMARRQFELIFSEIERKWPIESIRLVHRLGVVLVNEASLWVEVIASHRGEAFDACQYLIDEMKCVVPIWKKPLC